MLLLVLVCNYITEVVTISRAIQSFVSDSLQNILPCKYCLIHLPCVTHLSKGLLSFPTDYQQKQNYTHQFLQRCIKVTIKV